MFNRPERCAGGQATFLHEWHRVGRLYVRVQRTAAFVIHRRKLNLSHVFHEARNYFIICLDTYMLHEAYYEAWNRYSKSLQSRTGAPS